MKAAAWGRGFVKNMVQIFGHQKFLKRMSKSSLNLSLINETTHELLDSGKLNWFYWIIIQIKPFRHIMFAIQVGICVVGLLFNWIVFDTARQFRRPTSGTIWMKYIAIWDNLALVQGLVRGVFRLFGIDLASSNEIVCKVLSCTGSGTITIANAHLVAMSVDRAFNMAYPTLHYTLSWNKINRKISLAISLLYLILFVPVFFISQLDENICKEFPDKNTLATLYHGFLTTVCSFFTHFAIISVTTAIFIHQMRERRTPKPKLPVSALNHPRQPKLPRGSAPEATNGEVGVLVENDNPIAENSQTPKHDNIAGGTAVGVPDDHFTAVSTSNQIERGSQVVQVTVDIEQHDHDMPGDASIAAAAAENNATYPLQNQVEDSKCDSVTVPDSDEKGSQQTVIGRTIGDKVKQELVLPKETKASKKEEKEEEKEDEQTQKIKEETKVSFVGTQKRPQWHCNISSQSEGNQRSSENPCTSQLSTSSGGSNSSEAQSKMKVDKVRITLDSGAVKGVEAHEKSQNEGKKTKAQPNLSLEDRKAIASCQLICAWFLLCMIIGVPMTFLANHSDKDVLGDEGLQCIALVGRIFVLANHAFNFFFHLRGNLFRNTFKIRYFAWLRN